MERLRLVQRHHERHFVRTQMRLRLHIAPCFSQDIMQGVKAKLDNLINKYIRPLSDSHYLVDFRIALME